MRLLLSRSPSLKEKESRSGGGGGGEEGKRSTHVYLNVYDLTPMNRYLYWFGLGIFHSGIEVFGMEYGFGAHEYPTSGVFEVEPKGCPGFLFRRSVWLGCTDMSQSEFRMFIEHLAGKYHGDTYHLMSKNCNHFTDDVCQNLTGKSIPGWVNRLARLGSLCNCLLPEIVPGATVRRLEYHPTYFDDESESCLSSLSAADEERDAEDGLDHHLLLTAPPAEVISDHPPGPPKDTKLARNTSGS